MIRVRTTLHGVVQGVGFRPHVARTASRYEVTGYCGNDDESVFVEAQGQPGQVEAFLAAVVAEAPAAARILGQRITRLPVDSFEEGFRIVASQRRPGAITLISPDIATCEDCLRELNDPGDRRFGYPFITCTNCGPRLSIIRDLPYDRPLTTMAAFPMCASCREEYENPRDRRYHAQPISCFDCGPTLRLEARSEPADAWRIVGLWQEALTAARSMLADGKVLAVKGIGGFTLMCDARNQAAVTALRERKRRPGRPLAVMAGSLDEARRIVTLNPTEVRVLTGPQRPIVLATARAGNGLAPSVAPGLDEIGVMLPYSPVHQLLLDPGDVLVATSANSSSKPLTYRDQDAFADLGGIVDAFLIHDREIHVPVEDSVMAVDFSTPRPIRRSRGYAPLPVPLGDTDASVLAVGGELKNTFALTRNGFAFVSAHIGDMGTLETQQAFERSVRQQLAAHRRTPEVVVVDKHPGYASRAWGLREAERLGVPVLEVQHHHAHALSLLADRGMTGTPLVCAVWDGTGYGEDTAIWGGEILRLGADPLDYVRAWHLPEFWLPGGDAAVKRPWACALAVLAEFDIPPDGLPSWESAPDDQRALVRSQLENQVQVVRSTSAGRLFDAVASLLGVRQVVSYEAQAAMELEAAARRCPHPRHASDLGLDDAGLDVPGLDVSRLVAWIADRASSGTATSCLARLFHAGLAAVCARALQWAAPPGTAVGLSGGVFANRLFTADVVTRLQAEGREPVLHEVVPTNDGGLALGQALAGHLMLTRGS